MHNDLIPGRLVLEDSTVVTGWSFGHTGSISGEVVFNTAMTGYPESLTDPSYKGQILVLTFPLIGNYGVPDETMTDGLLKYFESEKIQVSGLVISDYSFEFSHWNARCSLSEWLRQFGIPAIFGVDTRMLTKRLREKGTMLGSLLVKDEDIPFYDPNQRNLVAEVSISERQVYGHGSNRILLIDCGVKNNIIRSLVERDCTVIRVPWDYDYSSEAYDGLFISNGPGDPKQCGATVEHLRLSFERDIPIFGICLGNQLMALAAGGDTYKLKYGHRSHNQPVLRAGSSQAYITSQNHGFAVDNDSLPGDWAPLFVNLNDNTNEGMRHRSKPFFSTQFHPEAFGGPSDTLFLFDEFMENVRQWKAR
jgi:carbamoyl-phosphate synthase small subunit